MKPKSRVIITSDARAEKLLARPYVEFNKELMQLGEDDVTRLLDHEKARRNRLTIKLRLHSRLNRLRRERERNALARTS